MIGHAAISRGFAAGVIATACLAATGANAATSLPDLTPHVMTTIKIVNNLDQALTGGRGDISNKKGFRFAKTPPMTIGAHSSGTFTVKKEKNSKASFTIEYNLKVGSLRLYYDHTKSNKGCGGGWDPLHGSSSNSLPTVVYSPLAMNQNATAPKVALVVTVKRCSDFKSKKWTYTIDPKK